MTITKKLREEKVNGKTVTAFASQDPLKPIISGSTQRADRGRVL